MAEEKSGYRLFSLGTAVEAKVEGLNWELEVSPIEITQLSDGALTNRGLNLETGGVDAAGTEYADKVITSSSINATWMGVGESNRRTCPNVEAGEEVLIYTYLQTGKFYWTPRNTNSHTRKLETVTQAYAADPAGGDGVTRTPDNSYIVEVSTHRKVITISTSAKNGELNKFTLQIHGGEGYATLQDDTGQEITMNPQENRISLINNQDVEVHLIGKDLNVITPGDENHTNQGNLNVTVTGDATVTSQGNVDVTAAGNATVTSALNTINGPTMLNGSVEISGGLVVAGFASLTGGHGPPD